MTVTDATIEEAWERLDHEIETESQRTYARAAMLASHDDGCSDCCMSVMDPSPEFIAWVEMRRRKCRKRLRIAALGVVQ